MDFKVTGIDGLGTFIKFGADDLEKFNNILNDEDLELDILIDNEWSFNLNTQLTLYNSHFQANRNTRGYNTQA